MVSFVELIAGGRTVRLHGSVTGDERNRGLYVTSGGIEGWYGTPDVKVSLTERGQGDGAHDVPESDILYAARTVTIKYGCLSLNRAETISMLAQVQWMAHRNVRLRVVDGDIDTYCEGYIATTVQPEWHSDYSWEDELTVVCPRPERLGWDTSHRFQLLPTADGNGGLWYGDGATGLSYPLQYGQAATDARNYGVMVNNGTSRAYPVITVYGGFPDGVQLDFTGGSSLWLDMNVGGTPVVLDSRWGTATCGGRDVTRNIRLRGFPVVPANGTLAVTLKSQGTGYVDVLTRDTYM